MEGYVDYITIVAPTYEEAVRKARDQYGDRLRIHSRKDVVSKGFLGITKSKHCELTCFLAGEQGSGLVDVPREREEAVSSSKDSSVSSKASGDEIEEADIRRFELEAKTPDPVSGKYRESDMQESKDEDISSSGNAEDTKAHVPENVVVAEQSPVYGEEKANPKDGDPRESA